MAGKRALFHPAKSAPKSHCIRGHRIGPLGFNWNRNATKDGVVYLTRRCKLCAVIDVQACRARAALRKSKKRAA